MTVSDEKIKHFITLFLADDLVSFFSLKLSKGWYHYLEELNFLLDLKRYLPEEVVYKMNLLVFSKLDFAIHLLNVSTKNEFSNIVYIKYRTFYDLLSHFATIELDRKIIVLLGLIVQNYKKKTNVIFFSSVIKSMAFYVAFNENIGKILIENRAILMKSREEADGQEMHPGMSLLIVFIFVLILFLTGKCH
ncbi:hypothetical protein ACQ9BO_07890 [Flavobacterium sp. P21]|uniref:hypothetical protein n=1 Tax=Flavobacterium sp. P21 TaxID=3423948 RepID=UPI003D670D50